MMGMEWLTRHMSDMSRDMSDMSIQPTACLATCVRRCFRCTHVSACSALGRCRTCTAYTPYTPYMHTALHVTSVCVCIARCVCPTCHICVCIALHVTSCRDVCALRWVYSGPLWCPHRWGSKVTADSHKHIDDLTLSIPMYMTCPY